MAKLGVSEGFPVGWKESKRERKEDKDEENEAYLTEGTPELKPARMWIASYSIARSKERLASTKRKRDDEAERAQHVAEKEQHKANFSKFINVTSEIGDERPLTAMGFSPDSLKIATGAWSGSCKLWNITSSSTCSHTVTLRGHTERIHDLSFHPLSCLNLSR